MPVQINEIVIRINVEPQPGNEKQPVSSENNDTDDGSFDAESTAEKILQIIREKNER